MYVRNDPVNLVDPDGREVEWSGSGWNTTVTVTASFSLASIFPPVVNAGTDAAISIDGVLIAARYVGPSLDYIRQAMAAAAQAVNANRSKILGSAFQSAADINKLSDKCKTFLNKVLAGLSKDMDDVSKSKHTISNLIIAVQYANYELYGNSSNVTDPSTGKTIGNTLTYNPDKLAVTIRPTNQVFLSDSFYLYSNPASVLLHEAFHESVILGNDWVGGFAATDAQIAQAAGVFTNDKNASRDFQNAISSNCP